MLAYSTDPILREKTRYGKIFNKQRKDELRKQREQEYATKVVDITAHVVIRPKMQEALKAYYGRGIEDRAFRNLIYDEVWCYLNLSKDNRYERLERLFNAVVSYFYEMYQL